MDSKVKIIYENSNGEQLEMGKFAPFYALDIKGFGMPENTLTTQNLYSKAGARLTQQQLDVRVLEINLQIMADSFAELQRFKRNAVAILNPENTGKLIYQVMDRVYEIDVNLVQGISDDEGKGATYQKSVLEFKALNPYWKDVSNSRKIQMVETSGQMFFDLEIPDDFIFDSSSFGDIVPVENTGSIEIGFTATFEFLGNVSNPRIINILQNEMLGLQDEYTAGDKVIISTIYGNKYMKAILANGSESNVIAKRQPGTTFMQLDKGTNYMVADADSGIDNMLITIEFVPLLLGV